MNSTQMCGECNGYQSGSVNMSCTTQIKICACNNFYSCNRQGWICPKCNKSLSPDIKECDCAPSNGYTYIPYAIPYTPYIPGNPFQPTIPYIPYYPTTPWWNTSPSPLYTNYLTITC